jgi:hypothetical protein
MTNKNINSCQYHEKISFNYSCKVSIILFDIKKLNENEQSYKKKKKTLKT